MRSISMAFVAATSSDFVAGIRRSALMENLACPPEAGPNAAK